MQHCWIKVFIFTDRYINVLYHILVSTNYVNKSLWDSCVHLIVNTGIINQNECFISRVSCNNAFSVWLWSLRAVCVCVCLCVHVITGGEWVGCVATTQSRSCWAQLSGDPAEMSTSWRRSSSSLVRATKTPPVGISHTVCVCVWERAYWANKMCSNDC